jgi:hypothetical protein
MLVKSSVKEKIRATNYVWMMVENLFRCQYNAQKLILGWKKTHSQRDVEHIGNNVIQTEQNEGKYRPPDSTFKRMKRQLREEKMW